MSAPRVVAVVQARFASSRFPGKVLADVGGKPMLGRVVERVRRMAVLSETVVATSDGKADDAVAAFCAGAGIPCFRGSESDVLDRFYQCARRFEAGLVVRVTADCPLLDPAVADRVVRAALEAGCDYACNILRATYPDGLDVEAFSFSVLERAWREARLPAEREHVTPYIRASGLFRVRGVESDAPAASCLRWSVDHPRDLPFVRAVYGRMGEKPFGWKEVLALLEKEPGMAEKDDTPRNEGYYLSLLKEPAPPPVPRKLEASNALKARAEGLIPSCSQTFSKAPSQFVQGVCPAFLDRGLGSRVWDADGNEYLDYSMALGPVILGHAYPAVVEAVKRQVERGTAFSLPHALEVEVAERLRELIPCAEMVRFGKNGSDVTAGAVRAARAVTGRDVIACCGYHGWQDWFIGTTTRNKGVPKAVRELTVPFEYNAPESLEKIFAEHPGRVAAVIMEPVGVVEPSGGFLEKVAGIARRNGALLIFDEVVTGFRIALGGAQAHFGVTPDLACFGKALGNGMPVSAVVGRKDVMAVFDEIFFSFTFGGEAVSLAAAKAVLDEMRSKDVIAHLWEQGRKLKEGYNVMARALGLSATTDCAGLPPRTVVRFRDEKGADSLLYKSFFQQECVKRGVLFTGGHNPSFSHTDADVDRTLRVYRAALELLARAVEAGDVSGKLEGPPLSPVFRRA